MSKHRNAVGAAALVLLTAIFLLAGYHKPVQAEDVRYIDFISLVNSGQVSEVTLSDKTKLSFRLADGTPQQTDNPRNPLLKEELLLKGVAVTETGAAASGVQSLIGIAAFAGAFYFFNRKAARPVAALNARDVSGGCCLFGDVAGNDEAKASVADLVDFLRSPEKYRRYGARMPRGVLFYGPPGTGKTLLARAVAGEAGVPFYAVSGSDFVQMYVGVGAGRIRELFKKARASERAVIFIDEIDALGRRRSSAAGGNDERDQTLNALLTEMSGFQESEGIIVIAATNRLDTLDEALLRPGRFDRQVEIGLPDRAARERILACHAKEKPLAAEVSLSELARDTVYFSGAMLENLLNEAAIESAKAGTDTITADAVERAYYTVLAGSEKKDRSGIRQRDREITAYHESGHALVAKLVAPEAVISRVSIIPSSRGAGGFCVNIPPDKLYYTKKELEAQAMISFGGRAAEELMFGGDHVTTGAANDLEKACALMHDYVTKFGMGETFNPHGKSAARECSALLAKLYAETIALLSEKKAALGAIADGLLARETLNAAELDELLYDQL